MCGFLFNFVRMCSCSCYVTTRFQSVVSHNYEISVWWCDHLTIVPRFIYTYKARSVSVSEVQMYIHKGSRSCANARLNEWVWTSDLNYVNKLELWRYAVSDIMNAAAESMLCNCISNKPVAEERNSLGWYYEVVNIFRYDGRLVF